MDLTLIRFGTGKHDATDAPTGDRDLCIMEAVAYIAGEPWSDAPACASPVVSAFLREWNDTLSDEDRDRLLPAAVWVPRLVDSLADNATEERRAYLALDWMIRVQTPAWLDLTPSLAPHAAALRALPEIVDLTTAENAVAVVNAAEAAARAARYAAQSAAWSAARASAGVAAREAEREAERKAEREAARAAAGVTTREAAWSAARAATREAAWSSAWSPARDAAEVAAREAARAAAWSNGDTISPIIALLQQSALDLLDRMLVVGAHPDRRKEE